MLNLQVPLDVLWIENPVGRVLKGWHRASGRSRIQEATHCATRIVTGLECRVTTGEETRAASSFIKRYRSGRQIEVGHLREVGRVCVQNRTGIEVGEETHPGANHGVMSKWCPCQAKARLEDYLLYIREDAMATGDEGLVIRNCRVVRQLVKRGRRQCGTIRLANSRRVTIGTESECKSQPRRSTILVLKVQTETIEGNWLFRMQGEALRG